MKKLLLLTLFSLFLWNCNTQKPTVTKIDKSPSFDALLNKTWLLQGDNGTVIQAGKAYNVKFTNGERQIFQAFFGCNLISGGVDTDASKISFGQAMATKMYCKETVLDENQVMNLLSKANNYTITGNELTLYEDKAPLLRFKSEQ